MVHLNYLLVIMRSSNHCKKKNKINKNKQEIIVTVKGNKPFIITSCFSVVFSSFLFCWSCFILLILFNHEDSNEIVLKLKV